MDLDLKDKVFIVSGGAKGIGEAITRELVQEGAKVAMAGRSRGAGEALQEELNTDGDQCLSIVAELSTPGTCQKVVKQVINHFGTIHGIVNNAGVNDGVGLEKGNPEAFIRSVATNLGHYYELVHYALPQLKKNWGSVVNISSKTALTGQGGTSGYTASKGAQLALTREWAVELAPYGIRVNAIVPAEVMTPQYAKWINSFDDAENRLKLITDRIPLGKRMTKAGEIATMVVFLLSGRSAHTTGQWIIVDGGYVHLDRAMR